MIEVSTPSTVRVFAKSFLLLAAGWVASVSWLWIAHVRLHTERLGGPPPDSLLAAFLRGALPAATMALIGIGISRWAGVSPDLRMGRREWWHAFWWSAAPNALLFATVRAMLRG